MVAFTGPSFNPMHTKSIFRLAPSLATAALAMLTAGNPVSAYAETGLPAVSIANADSRQSCFRVRGKVPASHHARNNAAPRRQARLGRSVYSRPRRCDKILLRAAGLDRGSDRSKG